MHCIPVHLECIVYLSTLKLIVELAGRTQKASLKAQLWRQHQGNSEHPQELI